MLGNEGEGYEVGGGNLAIGSRLELSARLGGVGSKWSRMETNMFEDCSLDF